MSHKLLKAFDEREKLQKQIVTIFGQELINKKKRKLCGSCSYSGKAYLRCFHDLIPVTIDGHDCYYHRKVNNE